MALLGLYIARLTWVYGATAYFAGVGLAVTALAFWVQYLVELVPRSQLTVLPDGEIRIRAGALLRNEVVFPSGDIRSISYEERTMNTPVGAHALTILGRGGYFRVELARRRTLAGARWSNLFWNVMRESDFAFVLPPLPRREVGVLLFSATAEDGNQIVESAR